MQWDVIYVVKRKTDGCNRAKLCSHYTSSVLFATSYNTYTSKVQIRHAYIYIYKSVYVQSAKGLNNTDDEVYMEILTSVSSGCGVVVYMEN